MRTFRSRCLLLLLGLCPVHAFLTPPTFGGCPVGSSALGASIAVPASELEKDLTPEEKSVISVVRSCGPSVAFVTSILPSNGSRRSGRQAQQRSTRTNLPQGQSLGSGSAFVVAPDGYLVTNYHVIETAYRVQSMVAMYQRNKDLFVGNVTQWLGKLGNEQLLNETLQSFLPKPPITLPEVYVRTSLATQFQPCRIVKVKPELDVAVLKIVNATSEYDTVRFGSSSKLLVGQDLIAIGNPFGLDQTVTRGVVSALNREMMGVAGNVIRNCIQTDCAINPGNSGGPLLNRDGEVVGVNTAIFTTSGSNAGIGFAIPSDQVRHPVTTMIQQDRFEQGERRNAGFMGLSILDSKVNLTSVPSSSNGPRLWVSEVKEGSPAAQAGIRPLQITPEDRLELGDCIVAIGGRTLKDYEDFQTDLEGRVQNEEVSITLEDAKGERRVVYVKLACKQWN